MNKGEFVSFIAENNKITKAEAERILDLFTGSVTKAISKKLEVTLVGFGSFYISKRAAREGRNPATGAKMKIKAYNQPAFRAGKKLKDACN